MWPDRDSATEQRRMFSPSTGRRVIAQSDVDNAILLRVLGSRACLWQLGVTLFTCTGVHVLLGWGSLTDWGDHDIVGICLFRWAHPAGYHGLATSLAEQVPLDAVLTAFFACLGAMKRKEEVHRGEVAHVPPDALHRGPLWFLFPRGIPELPLLSSLLGVTVVWGALWIGIGLGLLVAVWAPSGRLCMGGWKYVLGRAAWSTTQALLVSAGSFLLWCASLHHVAIVPNSHSGSLRHPSTNPASH